MNSLCLARDDLYHPVSQAYPAISPPPSPCRSGSLIQIDCHAEGSLTERSYVSPFRWTEGIFCKLRQRRVTIDVLPDVVLLEIFVCYMDEDEDENPNVDAWHALVHVSRNWRCVVFNSPRRLNLRLRCSARTPVREMLAIWPPLPIIIRGGHSARNGNGDNIIAALEHHDRVCAIDLRLHDIPSSLLEKVSVAMQEPFPALESLEFVTSGDTGPVVFDSFLGGSAPHLQVLELTGTPLPFPGLRKLLLSATDLVVLFLPVIPHSGYFSPEAIVTCLSALTRLESVDIGFPRSRPYRENRRLPPPTRTPLPALRSLTLTGVSEYLEDLVARIDAPLLAELYIIFSYQLIFDTPQLAQFISRNSRTQRDEVPKEALVDFHGSGVIVRLPGPFADGLQLGISCGQLDWQVSALEQVCRSESSFPQALIPTVEHLSINDGWKPHCQDDMDDSQWLELLHPFVGVKNLFLSSVFAPRIALALQELVGERVYDVLPALQSINLEGPGVAPEGIGHFVDARHLSSHPVAIVPWSKY